MIHAGLRLDLLAQVVGRRLAEQGLAAARGTVQQKALGNRVLEALEQVGRGRIDTITRNSLDELGPGD